MGDDYLTAVPFYGHRPNTNPSKYSIRYLFDLLDQGPCETSRLCPQNRGRIRYISRAMLGVVGAIGPRLLVWTGVLHFLDGIASDLLDGSNFVQPVTASDPALNFCRAGRDYTCLIKRNFKAQFASLSATSSGLRQHTDSSSFSVLRPRAGRNTPYRFAI